jgi:hypothetical protein
MLLGPYKPHVYVYNNGCYQEPIFIYQPHMYRNAPVWYELHRNFASSGKYTRHIGLHICC